MIDPFETFKEAQEYLEGKIWWSDYAPHIKEKKELEKWIKDNYPEEFI